MNSLTCRSLTDPKKMEELAKKFASKSPYETTFNNNKSKKYFNSSTNVHKKDSMSSQDTIKMSFNSGRKSNLSIINSDFSQRQHTLSRCFSSKTENDKDISCISNIFIVCCDKLSSKKEAVKLDQKLISEEQDIVNFDEIIEESDGYKVDKSENEKTINNINSKSTFVDETTKLFDQRLEILIQLDNFYTNVKSAIIQNNHNEINKLIIYWYQIIPGTLDIIYQDKIFFKEILQENLFLSQIVIELILFAIVFQRELKNDIMNGFKNSIFYIQQNYIIHMSNTLLKIDNIDNNVNAKEISKRIEEDGLRLVNKSQKKLISINNEIILNMISNIISHIKLDEVNVIEDLSNLDIVLNYLKEYTTKSSDLKQSVFSLCDFLNENFIQRKILNLLLKEPFLPSKNDLLKYTLVLDLDETLVHYVEEEDNAYILIRPGAEKFLEELSKYYEIVIFTAATQDYADFVLNELDKLKCISHRLYRQHTIKMENCTNVKDLSKIGRDLSKTIIIDNVKENFQLQKDNGLHIKDFIDNVKDNELSKIIDDLILLAKSGTNDIRKGLNKIREKMNVY